MKIKYDYELNTEMQHIQVKSEQVRKDEQAGIKVTQSHTHETHV